MQEIFLIYENMRMFCEAEGFFAETDANTFLKWNIPRRLPIRRE